MQDYKVRTNQERQQQIILGFKDDLREKRPIIVNKHVLQIKTQKLGILCTHCPLIFFDIRYTTRNSTLKFYLFLSTNVIYLKNIQDCNFLFLIDYFSLKVIQILHEHAYYRKIQCTILCSNR